MDVIKRFHVICHNKLDSVTATNCVSLYALRGIC